MESEAGLDPDRFGPALFAEYPLDGYLMVKPAIISVKTLKQELDKKQITTL